MSTVIPNLHLMIDTIAPDSIISRTVYLDDHMRTIVFGFDVGQELSEHSTGQTAIIQILEGEAEVTLNGVSQHMRAGAWIHMPPHLKHSIHAATPLIMLLTMIKTETTLS